MHELDVASKSTHNLKRNLDLWPNKCHAPLQKIKEYCRPSYVWILEITDKICWFWNFVQQWELMKYITVLTWACLWIIIYLHSTKRLIIFVYYVPALVLYSTVLQFWQIFILCIYKFLYYVYIKDKGKAVPLQAWSCPEGCRKLRFPDFMTTAQDGGKVVSLMHRPPLPPGNTPGIHFC